jgi:hypothetical protein
VERNLEGLSKVLEMITRLMASLLLQLTGFNSWLPYKSKYMGNIMINTLLPAKSTKKRRRNYLASKQVY